MASSLDSPIKTKMTVLLDTDVITSYLRGKPELAKLFSSDVLEAVQYAINPVILQELLLAGQPFPEGFDISEFSSKFQMVPVEVIDSKDFLERLQSFSNRHAHTNSFLILGSGRQCDVVLSYDVNMMDLSEVAGVNVLNPEDFLAQLERDR